MKKIIILLIAMLVSVGVWAQPKEATSLAKTQTAQAEPIAPRTLQKKEFKARRKLVRKLLKEYRRAPQDKKPAIKAQLAQIVSQGVDAGRAYVRARIAAERTNLDNWENKLNAEEQNLDQLKAQRLEELLSGEAKKKHKAAKKQWKKQMKSLQK